MSESTPFVEASVGEILSQHLSTPDPHITARRLQLEDSEWLFEFGKDELVARHVPWNPEITSINQVEERIGQWKADGSAGYTVEYDQQPCGFFHVWADYVPGFYLTASALLPEYRGRGIINSVYFELEKQLVERIHARGMVSYPHAENRSSIRMLEKRGYTRGSEVIRFQGKAFRYTKLLQASDGV